jgi:hypothetical protein
MKVITVKGVEHVQLAVGAAVTAEDIVRLSIAVEALGRDLGRPNGVCSLCVRRDEEGHTCPHLGYLVEATIYPLLKLRLPPGALKDPKP